MRPDQNEVELPPKIIPTVGRVVWFWPTRGVYMAPEAFTHFPDQPCAATVAYVHSPDLVNLSVIDHTGNQHSFGSVRLIQAGEAEPEFGRFCQWMPFQVGQAKAQLAK